MGLAPGEKVPAPVRILASQHNLGALRSIHRPATWWCRIHFRGAAYLVFERGVVRSQKDGAQLRLFKVGQMRIMNTGDRTFLLDGPQGRIDCAPLQWSDGELLTEALSKWATSS